MFQPTRPARDATLATACSGVKSPFQPTRPARDATRRGDDRGHAVGFNPRAPRGTRRGNYNPALVNNWFQPTRPARDATRDVRRGVRRARVSTHAPRAGRDVLPLCRPCARFCFNPRAPRGTRQPERRPAVDDCAFQPTRPARDATEQREHTARSLSFNPRAPRGTRPGPWAARGPQQVSTHAPRAGRDAESVPSGSPSSFQPTRPARDATGGRCTICAVSLFQPTRPARDATYFRGTDTRRRRFQPTRPARDATGPERHQQRRLLVSTHAPRAGRDAGHRR